MYISTIDRNGKESIWAKSYNNNESTHVDEWTRQQAMLEKDRTYWRIERPL